MRNRFFNSSLERKTLILIAFFALVFSILAFNHHTTKADRKRNEFFSQQEENKAQNKFVLSGPYCFPDTHPQKLRLIIALIGIVFFVQLFRKHSLASFPINAFSVGTFVYWFLDTRKEVALSELEIKGLDNYLYNAGVFDLFTLGLISILFLWQISILLRMLIKKLNGKEILP